MNITVDLSLKTCSCGTVFGVPNWVTSWRCPMCAHRKMETLCEENERLMTVITERDRSISALKGAITKLKGGDGRG